MPDNRYCKLFSSILRSSVWFEDHATVRVWITILALKDGNGVVHGSEEYLAYQARVTLKECEAALNKFMSSDPASHTKEQGGRRLTQLSHDEWLVINHAKYRDLSPVEMNREYWRVKKKNFRDRRRAKRDKLSTYSARRHTHVPPTPDGMNRVEEPQAPTEPAAAEPAKSAE
jgi:hypothetical protein